MRTVIMPVIFIGFSCALLCLALIAYVSDAVAGAASLCVVAFGYLIFGIVLFRAGRMQRLLPSWTSAAAIGLAIMEIGNVYLEQFVGLASPANAIVPASFMAAMVLTASTVAVLAAKAGLWRGVFSSLVTLGAAMLIAVTIILIAVRSQSGEPNAAAALLSSTVGNATTHLTLPLVVALLAGTLAGTVSRFAVSRGRRVCMLVSLAAIPLLFSGIAILVGAAALLRSQRPPLVMAGMLLCAIALSVLPTVLGHRDSAMRQ